MEMAWLRVFESMGSCCLKSASICSRMGLRVMHLMSLESVVVFSWGFPPDPRGLGPGGPKKATLVLKLQLLESPPYMYNHGRL